ncbi:hypothetical protein KFY46_26360, partial [Salmonella enterica subsp. enterica serovar 1,4,[5],12:i:-]|nr:hypothetical protein [Salmonella enterica subsp. enterica serovar 1,4,[5],12:i:-]
LSVEPKRKSQAVSSGPDRQVLPPGSGPEPGVEELGSTRRKKEILITCLPVDTGNICLCVTKTEKIVSKATRSALSNKEQDENKFST